MNPKEIEDLMHVMSETRVEYTIRDESHKGAGTEDREQMRIRKQSSTNSSLLAPQSRHWINRRRMLSRNHAGHRRHRNKHNCGDLKHHRIPHIRLRPLRN
jgi:hypothetical protein